MRPTTFRQPLNLSPGHFVYGEFRQTCTTAQWRQFLLEHERWIIFRGEIRNLRAKSLGAGVMEIRKEPLKTRP